MITDGEADMCDFDPGHPVAVTLTASLRGLVGVWRGDLSWSDAVRAGSVQISGPERLRRSVPDWFTLSPFASVPRPS